MRNASDPAPRRATTFSNLEPVYHWRGMAWQNGGGDGPVIVDDGDEFVAVYGEPATDARAATLLARDEHLAPGEVYTSAERDFVDGRTWL